MEKRVAVSRSFMVLYTMERYFSSALLLAIICFSTLLFQVPLTEAICESGELKPVTATDCAACAVSCSRICPRIFKPNYYVAECTIQPTFAACQCCCSATPFSPPPPPSPSPPPPSPPPPSPPPPSPPPSPPPPSPPPPPPSPPPPSPPPPPHVCAIDPVPLYFIKDCTSCSRSCGRVCSQPGKGSLVDAKCAPITDGVSCQCCCSGEATPPPIPPSPSPPSPSPPSPPAPSPPSPPSPCPSPPPGSCCGGCCNTDINIQISIKSGGNAKVTKTTQSSTGGTRSEL